MAQCLALACLEPSSKENLYEIRETRVVCGDSKEAISVGGDFLVSTAGGQIRKNDPWTGRSFQYPKLDQMGEAASQASDFAMTPDFTTAPAGWSERSSLTTFPSPPSI
jgi:hypothetical protein